MKKLNDSQLSIIWEGLEQEEYVVASYVVGAGIQGDIVAKSVALAVEQSTGSWISVPSETGEVRHKHAAKVIGIYGIPDYELISSLPREEKLRLYLIRVAYPWVNFGSNLPLMLSMVVGNISSMPNLKLVDLEFPSSFVNQFKGPKFGVQGIRDLLGVHDRPLLNNMIKPCTGISPQVGAELLYQAARGGVDWVKDDELIAGDLPFSPLRERVSTYMDAARRADAEKGERTLYTVNITDQPAQFLENALQAQEAGANALMVNVFAVGLAALRELAEDDRVQLPIMAHTCFGGAMTSSPISGVGSVVAAKLARLAGADIYLNVAPSAKFNALQDKFVRIQQVSASPFYHIRPIFNLAGGGVTPGMVPYLMGKLGLDFVIGAGAAIHGHPMGPGAGASAFRQAIQAVLSGDDIAKASEDKPELKVALERWGIYGQDDYTHLYDIEA